jgi:hypothetical protein
MNGALPGAKVRSKLVAMRTELIARLEVAVDGGSEKFVSAGRSLALLGSLQLAIDAIDCAATEEDRSKAADPELGTAAGYSAP